MHVLRAQTHRDTNSWNWAKHSTNPALDLRLAMTEQRKSSPSEVAKTVELPVPKRSRYETDFKN